MTAIGYWNAQMEMHERIDGKFGVHARQEIFESVSGDGGSENFVRAAPVGFDQRGEIFGGEQIGFVENLQPSASWLA